VAWATERATTGRRPAGAAAGWSLTAKAIRQLAVGLGRKGPVYTVGQLAAHACGRAELGACTGGSLRLPEARIRQLAEHGLVGWPT
jgi:hypothetical protein